MQVANFKATHGWCRRFMNRFNLVFRRISSSGRDLPKNSIDLVLEFFNKIRELIGEHNFTLNQILNMDESSFYMDMPGNYTIAQKGLVIE